MSNSSCVEKNVEGVNCPFGSSSKKSLQEVENKVNKAPLNNKYFAFIILIFDFT